MPVSEDSWETECYRWGLGKLWDEWVSWAQEGFPMDRGWWLAMETGQELRRAWDDWDSNGTVTRWIGTIMHGSANVTQVIEWVGNIVQKVLINFSALGKAWKE